MEVRRASINDIKRIHKLLKEVNRIHHDGRPDIFKLSNKYTDEELSILIQDDKRPIFVGVLEETVVGYCFCVLKQNVNDNMLTDIKTLYIDDLCIDSNMRKKHIGSTIYNYVLDYAKKIGCYNVTLNVWELNQEAKAFYMKMGLLPLKTEMEHIL